MKEYIVTKRISNPEVIEESGLSNEELERSEDTEELLDDEKFYVVKIKDRNNKDLTSKIDTNLEFEDDEDLTEYLAKVFKEDPDEIEIIEEESTFEFRSSK